MKVLIAYDGSTSADIAIEDLRRAGLPPRTEALVVCVADGLTLPDSTETEKKASPPEESWKSKIRETEILAEKAVDRIRKLFPLWTVSHKAFWGSAAKIILETAARWHVDLIVSGSHGRSRVAGLFLGSVSLELIHKAPCSVRISRVRASAPANGPIRFVIGNDGST